MKITFDRAKRDATFAERGLAFEDAEIVFEGDTVTFEDEYGETRYQTIGFLDDRMVMVVWTPRREDRHVMSMRKCNDREQAKYQKRFEEG